MTDETAVSTLYETNITPNVQIVRYDLPSVSGGGVWSDMIRLHLPDRTAEATGVRGEAVVHGMRVASDSTNFDIVFFNESTGQENTLSEFLSYYNIDTYKNDYPLFNQMSAVFVNRDDPRASYMYCKVFNSGNISGIIHLELIIS